MATTVTITQSPKVHKHVDACAFQFRNDTDECIESGAEIKVGELVGYTTYPVGPGDCAAAQLKCGPIMGYRMYLETPLETDVCLGQAVFNPVTGDYLGLAIHGGTQGGSRGLSEPAAAAGTSCIWFLCLPSSSDGTGGSGPGEPGEVMEPACNSYSGPDAVPPGGFPTTEPATGATINGSTVVFTPPAGTVVDLEAWLADFPKDSLPNGYQIKLTNGGDGQITYPADVTGDVIPFNRNEFVCLVCCDGAWEWNAPV